MQPRARLKKLALCLTTGFFSLAGVAHAQTAGMGLNPGRAEVEILPGSEKTVGFQIESPTSDEPVRGRLLLSLTDWSLDQNATAVYADPAALPNSASPWTVFSPTAVSISSGQTHLVRVTVKVPVDAKPGVYRTGIFVQERPPATPPIAGTHMLYFRFRYMFTLYVVVPPVTLRGELSDVSMQSEPEGIRLVYEAKNVGSRHLRPRISWSIQNAQQEEITSARNEDFTVLLPFSTVATGPVVASNLPPGRYELAAEMDFNDGAPVQAIRRTVEILSKQETAQHAGSELAAK